MDEKGLLHHTCSLLGVETYRQTSTEPIPTGEVTRTMLSGTVKRVVFDLKPHVHADERALHEQAAMVRLGQGAAG